MMRTRSAAALVAGCALVCVLMAAGLRLPWLWVPSSGGSSFVVPLLDGRELDVAVWTREAGGAAPAGWLPPEQERRLAVAVPVTVDVSYQNPGALTSVRLARTVVAAWPLLIVAGCLGLGAAWLWRRSRSGAS